jgi:hypothetical protein
MAKKNTRTRRRRRASTIESSEPHHYYSKMAFDGKTLVSESQKDNEPVRRRVYTLKQLKREIPLAAKFVEEDLGGVIPEAIHHPIPKELAFRSVLPNPADLGLLPPRESRRRFRPVRRMRPSRRKSRSVPAAAAAATAADERENMRLVVQDNAAADDDAVTAIDRRSNLFDLPI